MSQVDHNLANQTFPSFRTELNSTLAATQTLNSGASAPSTTFQFMWWADTTNGLLKQRNAADTSWIIIGKLDNNGLTRSNAGNPNGSVTGDFTRQELIDSSNFIKYFYSGSSSAWYQSKAQPETFNATVGTNALTFTLNPGIFDFRSSTITSGLILRGFVNSAITLTIPASTTIGSINNDSREIHLYAYIESGTVKLAASLDGCKNCNKLQNITAISGGADPTKLYGTASASNVPIKYIGKITAPQTAAGTWASSPTSQTSCEQQPPAQGDWINYGVLSIAGSTTNPTKGTTVIDEVLGRRVGKELELKFAYRQSGAGGSGSGTYLLALPGNYSADTNVINVDTSANAFFAAGAATPAQIRSFLKSGGFLASTTQTSSELFFGCYSATQLKVLPGVAYTNPPTSAGGGTGHWGSGLFALGGSAMNFIGFASVPIAGWELPN